MPEVVSAAGRLGNYLIVKCPSSPEMEGRSLEDVAAVDGKSVIDVAAGLMAADRLDVWAAWPISLDDVHTVIRAG